jgi:hypothetical protein
MRDLFLIFWLATGEREIQSVTEHECREVIAAVDAARTLGLEGRVEDGTLVVRVSCGDADIVLALPTSDGDCEVTS